MTLGMDPQQLASAAMELVRNHWTAAAIPLADGALKEAGKSLFNLMTEVFTSKAASGALEEAAEKPADPDSAAALKVQIEKTIKTNPEFAENLRKLIGSLPEEGRTRIVQTASQTGDKNVINQVAGDSNKISVRNA